MDMKKPVFNKITDIKNSNKTLREIFDKNYLTMYKKLCGDLISDKRYKDDLSSVYSLSKQFNLDPLYSKKPYEILQIPEVNKSMDYLIDNFNTKYLPLYCHLLTESDNINDNLYNLFKIMIVSKGRITYGDLVNTKFSIRGNLNGPNQPILFIRCLYVYFQQVFVSYMVHQLNVDARRELRDRSIKAKALKEITYYFGYQAVYDFCEVYIFINEDLSNKEINDEYKKIKKFTRSIVKYGSDFSPFGQIHKYQGVSERQFGRVFDALEVQWYTQGNNSSSNHYRDVRQRLINRTGDKDPWVSNYNKFVYILENWETARDLIADAGKDSVLEPLQDFNHEDVHNLLEDLVNDDTYLSRAWILYSFANEYKISVEGKSLNSNGENIKFKTIRGNSGTILTPLFYLYDAIRIVKGQKKPKRKN